jgi:hypothetical protein
MPEDTVRLLDSVEIEVPAEVVVVAVIRTVVATLPPVTIVCTWPFASATPEVGAIEIPPTVVFGVKVTDALGLGPPEVLMTLNITVDVAVPTPFKGMFDGVADTNWIDPTCDAAIVTVPLADSDWLFADAVAVMTSAPLQPVAA